MWTRLIPRLSTAALVHGACSPYCRVPEHLPPSATLILYQLCAMAGRELLLPFDDVYCGLATRPASFAGALPSKEPSVLENLRSLGALRNAVSKASLPSTSTGDRVTR